MKRFTKLTVAIALVTLASIAWGDTLYLRDGEQVEGQLTRMTDRKVRFEGADGKVTIDKADLVKIQLQRARAFDDVASVDQIVDPDLKRCVEQQPSDQDYPAAGSVVLLARVTYDCTEPGIVKETVRRIVKVLRQRGENVASQNVWYFEDTDTPEIDFALTVTPDGRVLHLNDAALKNEVMHTRLPDYRRLARFRFASKEPRPGSILDMQYTVVRKRGGALEPFYVEAQFRGGEPIVEKEVHVVVNQSREDTIAWALSGPNVVREGREVDGDAVHLSWTLSEPQQGVVPEPLMPPRGQFVPVLALGEAASYEDLAGVYARTLAELPELPDDLVAKAKELGKPGAIYGFVARGIRTAPVPHTSFRFAPYTPAATFQRGIANELDKNVLFRAMLHAIGVESDLAFVRPRPAGPLMPDVPSLKAFRRCALRLPSGRFVTTASDRLPFGTLPGELQGTQALVVAEDATGGLATTQATAPADDLDLTRFEGALAADGSLSLTVTYSGTGNAVAWMRGLKDLDEQQLTNQLRQFAGYLHPATRLAEHRTTNLGDLTEPPAITLVCEIPGYASTAGEDLMLFTLPSLYYDASDVGRPRRAYDLFWPHVGRTATTGHIALPDGFTVYSAPDPVAIDTAVASYRAKVTIDDGIGFNDAYDLKVAAAPKDAYGEYKACKEQRARLPRQRIILTRGK
ncbi:MAG: DUF3857 domain-containing protein [bacterium]|nr:DUF3857 domain-containing protein [bacterium]